MPVAVAALLTRALMPVASRLRRVGLRPGLAAVATLLGFLIVLAGAAAVIGVAVAGELDDLGPTLSEGVDDVTDWLVEDGPFDVSRSDVERWREQAGDTLFSFIGSGDDRLVSGAIIAVEVVIGSLLAVIVTFFFLKDGPRMFDRAVALFPVRRQPLARRVGGRAWTAIGGYLRGAALLGAVQSVTVGDASLAVGSSLVAPIMLITFLAASSRSSGPSSRASSPCSSRSSRPAPSLR